MRAPIPWGNRFTQGERCNSGNHVGTTAPANEYPEGRSLCGVWDLRGNVYEWCADFYDEDYYKTAPASNPKGPEEGQQRVVRGGCFQDSFTALRTTHRMGAAQDTVRDIIGFRIGMGTPTRPRGGRLVGGPAGQAGTAVAQDWTPPPLAALPGMPALPTYPTVQWRQATAALQRSTGRPWPPSGAAAITS